MQTIQFRVIQQFNDSGGGTMSTLVNVEAANINDGFVLAAVRAHALSSSTTDTELVSIEFWQVLPDRQPPAVVVGNDAR